jgi:hypothetical protein
MRGPFTLRLTSRAAGRLGVVVIAWAGGVSQMCPGWRPERVTHYEIVQGLMAVDGWCRLRLGPCPTVGGWRRLATAGVGRAGARRGQGDQQRGMLRLLNGSSLQQTKGVQGCRKNPWVESD